MYLLILHLSIVELQPTVINCSGDRISTHIYLLSSLPLKTHLNIYTPNTEYRFT